MKKDEADLKPISRLVWGVGIEHEVLPLYKQVYKRKISSASNKLYPVRDAVTLTDRIWNSLETLLSDKHGRDISRYPMIVSGDSAGNRECFEFSTREWKNRTLTEYVNDLICTRESFIADFNLVMSRLYPHRVLRDGGFSVEWPSVGAEYILYPRNKRFVDIPRYLGSYHINVTLPHTARMSNSYFVRIHQKAAIAIQWIEPLLMSLLGCPNPGSVFDGHNFTELSVRHAEEPLAMAVSRDILKYGFAADRKHEDLHRSGQQFFDRMTRVKFAQDRDRLLSHEPALFDQTDSRSRRRALRQIENSIKERVKLYPAWLKSIFKHASTSPLALRHFIRYRYGSYANGFNDMPVIGTDFRRDRSKGARFGFEFRMLDYFSPDKLLDVLRVLYYVMDVSATWPDDKTSLSKYDAFGQPAIHNQIVSCILEGWHTTAQPEYVTKLFAAFGLQKPAASYKLKTCEDVMTFLQQALFDKFGGGKGKYSRYVDKTAAGEFFSNAPQIHNVNKESWESFFEKSFADVAKRVASMKSKVTMEDLLNLLHLPDDQSSRDRIEEDLEQVQAYQESKKEKTTKTLT